MLSELSLSIFSSALVREEALQINSDTCWLRNEGGPEPPPPPTPPPTTPPPKAYHVFS